MKTTPEERATLRAHAVKGAKAPRTTAMFTADAILRLLDDVDELLVGGLRWVDRPHPSSIHPGEHRVRALQVKVGGEWVDVPVEVH